jgi:hypothetical protein
MKYEDRELLDRVVHYYHGRVFEDETVRGYLQKVGLAHQETMYRTSKPSVTQAV